MNANIYFALSAFLFGASYFVWKAFRQADFVEAIDPEIDGLLDEILTEQMSANPAYSLEKTILKAAPAGWSIQTRMDLGDALTEVGAPVDVVVQADRTVDIVLRDQTGTPRMAVFIGPLPGDDEQVDLAADNDLPVYRSTPGALVCQRHLAKCIAKI